MVHDRVGKSSAILFRSFDHSKTNRREIAEPFDIGKSCTNPNSAEWRSRSNDLGGLIGLIGMRNNIRYQYSCTSRLPPNYCYCTVPVQVQKGLFIPAKIRSEKVTFTGPEHHFWRSVKVFLERKSHFYGRGASEDFLGNFYGPYFCILLV